MSAYADATTQQVPTPEDLPARPLTDDELLRRYGALLWEALTAFATQPDYFTVMCEAANVTDAKREAWRQAGIEREERAKLGKLRARLGDKVRPEGECWSWTGATTRSGVPAMKVPGKTASVTVRSWTVEQWFGPDPTRWMIAAGECGNRLCVSPKHATWRHVERGKRAG